MFIMSHLTLVSSNYKQYFYVDLIVIQETYVNDSHHKILYLIINNT